MMRNSTKRRADRLEVRLASKESVAGKINNTKIM